MSRVGKSLWVTAAAVVVLVGSLTLMRKHAADAETQAAPAAGQAAAAQPAGSSLAIVDTGALASQSKLGQALAAELDALRERKNTEINTKRQQAQAAQEKLQTDQSLNDAARASLQRDIERMGRELQFDTEGAQAEMQSLQMDVQRRFDAALGPVLDRVATARGLQMVFGRDQSGLLWAAAALDLTPEIIKALDAAHPGGQ